MHRYMGDTPNDFEKIHFFIIFFVQIMGKGYFFLIEAWHDWFHQLVKPTLGIKSRTELVPACKKSAPKPKHSLNKTKTKKYIFLTKILPYSVTTFWTPIMYIYRYHFISNNTENTNTNSSFFYRAAFCTCENLWNSIQYSWWYMYLRMVENSLILDILFYWYIRLWQGWATGKVILMELVMLESFKIFCMLFYLSQNYSFLHNFVFSSHFLFVKFRKLWCFFFCYRY